MKTLSLLALFVFALTACERNHSNSSTPPSKVADATPTPTPAQNGAESVESSDIAAELFLTKENQDLRDTGGNSVTLKGRGKESKLRVTYAFFTGANNSFKILQMKDEKAMSDCNFAQTHLKLINGNQSVSINVGHPVSVRPQNLYKLEVTVEHECKRISAFIDMIAWVGSAGSNPRVLAKCLGEQREEALFGLHGPEMYLAGSLFNGIQAYCGEKVDLSYEAECKLPSKDFLDRDATTTEATCVSKSRGNTYESNMLFNSPGASVLVTCEINKEKVFQRFYDECSARVVDTNLLKH